jgi:protein tyrosine/serine phosphatase
MFGLSTAARLHPGLLRGGQPSEAALAWLRRQGVRTIVNLRRDALAGEPATAARLGLDYVAIPLDASTPPTLDEIERFMSTVTDPARQPVYVHCKHGVDRTGALAAVYRMEVDGWSPEAATDEMLQLGFHRIWLDLRRFVERYRPLGRWRHLSAASTPGPAAPVSPVGAAP